MYQYFRHIPIVFVLFLLLVVSVPSRADLNQGLPGLPLTGRVVSPDGKPLAHVPVYVFIKSPMTVTDPMTNAVSTTIHENAQTVKTDDNGYYVAQGVRPGDTVTLFVSKPGCRYISGGDVGVGEGGYQASVMVVAPPVMILGGKVTLPGGDPVPDATVIAPASNIELIAKTDPTGQFVLEGLPAGDTDIIAVAKSGYARLKAQAGQQGVKITLNPISFPDAQDKPHGIAILTTLSRDTSGGDYIGRDSLPFEIAPYDLNAALELAGKDHVPTDAVLLGLVTSSALGDPASSITTVNSILDRIGDPAEKALAAASLGFALTPAHNDLAAPLLEKAKAWARQSPIEHIGGGERIAVAALAARLKDRNAGKMIDDTISDMTDGARRANKGNALGASGIIEDMLDNYANVVAPAGSAYIERVIRRLPATATDSSATKRQPRILPALRAATILARYDAPDAAGLLRDMLAQGANTGMPVYGQAVCAIVEQLSATDPAGALTLARSVVDQDHKPIALAFAASGLSSDQAPTVWRDALSSALVCKQRSSLAGWVCALAYRHDPKLGAMLFASAYQALSSQVSLLGGMSAFMFYYGHVDPARARVAIERDYAADQLDLRASGDDRSLLLPVLAMSALDIDRALEMAADIHGPTSPIATRKVAQYAMLSPDQKRTLRFDRWMEPDAWFPGTPLDR